MGAIDQERGFRDSTTLIYGALSADLLEFRQRYVVSCIRVTTAGSYLVYSSMLGGKRED